MHVHCPVCKQVQISYVIRPHIDQTLKNLGPPLELQRKMDFHTKKRDRSCKEKRLRWVRKKGMAHRKRAWHSKNRAWHSAMLKGPRGNTKGRDRERSGSVVECLTQDRGAAGSSLTGVTALWSLSKTHLS